MHGVGAAMLDASKKRVVTEPLELTQEFRQFDALSPWTVRGN